MTNTPKTWSGLTESWPRLAVRDWEDTRDTLHLCTQIIGKVRLAQEPMINHWWQVPLYLSARGLTTSAIPYDGGLFEIEFDFVDHQLHLRSTAGQRRRVALEPKPVATFYRETMAALRALGVEVPIRPVPVEIVRAIPFAEDTEHASYNPARRQW